jgi:hypothetical protein
LKSIIKDKDLYKSSQQNRKRYNIFVLSKLFYIYIYIVKFIETLDKRLKGATININSANSHPWTQTVKLRSLHQHSTMWRQFFFNFRHQIESIPKHNYNDWWHWYKFNFLRWRAHLRWDRTRNYHNNNNNVNKFPNFCV